MATKFSGSSWAFEMPKTKQEEIAQRLFNAFKSYKTKYDASMKMEAEPVAKSIAPAETAAALAEVVKTALENSETKPKDYYGIQIMGLGRLLKDGDAAFKGLSAEAVKAEDSTIYKYVVARSDSKEGAQAKLAEVKKKFPEAFVVKVTGDKVERVK